MGMSSSQARLLTLTGRMHSIEQKAQRIQAEKLRLANESDHVYDEYIEALDATKLVAKVLAPDGSLTNAPFTSELVYRYNGLMNQYALKSRDDKALIPENISDIYKQTNSLDEFLTHFVPTNQYKTTGIEYKPNPDYDLAIEKWEDDQEKWEDDYEQKLDDWERQKPDPDDKTQPWWTTSSNDELARKFEEAGDSCYDYAIEHNGTGCYAHVLAHIIDYTPTTGFGDDGLNESWYDGTNNKYTTTTGQTTTIGSNEITGAGLHSTKSNYETLSEVSEVLQDESKMKAPQNGDTCDVTEASSDFEKLKSKWNVDGSLKSMKQWAIDLFYLCDNHSTVGATSADVTSTITIYQEHLKASLTERDEDLYKKAIEDWEKQKPGRDGEPQKSDYTAGLEPYVPYEVEKDIVGFENKNLAQWYINIWHKMEGDDDIPLIVDNKVTDDTGKTKIVYSIKTHEKSTTTYETNPKTGAEENENYIIIPTDKVNDPEWLRNSILEGFVIIQEFDELNSRFFNTSVSVATLIHEVPDETNLKKAEAKYEADMKRIDAKDARYDRELAVCDNERNAIKNEMETLKTVANENVERTFKLFS